MKVCCYLLHFGTQFAMGGDEIDVSNYGIKGTKANYKMATNTWNDKEDGTTINM